MLTPSNGELEIIDLGMSDEQYLQLLAQGQDPIQTHFYQKELVQFGFSPPTAETIAPLLDKRHKTLEEKILVGQALSRVWDYLSRMEGRSLGL